MTEEDLTPQQKKALATRNALLSAAREKFTEDGYSGTSLETIVKTAGVTKGALFHHFKDKAGLFYEVWLNLEQEMNTKANDEAWRANKIKGQQNQFAGFIAGCGVYFDFAKRPDYRRIVMIDGAAVMGEYEWRRIDATMGIATVANALDILYKSGAIRTRPTKALIVMIQGAVHGAGYAIAREEEGLHKEDLLARIESTLRRL